MPRENTSLQAFNRGKISKLALARTDLTRTALSADEQVNYIPRVLGSMSFRPGLQYIGSTQNSEYAVHIPFIAAINDTAIIELTAGHFRVRVNDVVISRPSVSTSILNGTFDTNLNDWSDDDVAGGVSAWASSGYMSLIGTRYSEAKRSQTLAIAPADVGVEHAIKVSIIRGVVGFRIGSTSGTDDLVSSTLLYPGNHSLAFTPTTSNVYIQVYSNTEYASLVDYISMESAGDMVVPTIWGSNDLLNVRTTQSVDVVFCAAKGKRQQRIERRTTRSWSVVDYQVDDGPFMNQNTTAITLTPAALSGDTTLTASQNFFKSTNVGSLFRISSVGQNVTNVLNGADQYTDYIKVTGIGVSRTFNITRAGTWATTLTVQRSVGEPGAWVDTSTTFTTNGTSSFNDSLDNEIIYYRVGFKGAGYSSGSATVTMAYASAGSITGICRVTGYTSGTAVNVSVLKSFGAVTASETWSEGDWSDRRGFPTATRVYEGRLWWAGKDKIWASSSDAYSTFDDGIEGDSGPISRSIGEGPLEVINWLLPLQRLIIGGQGGEFSARSSSFDEVMSPDNFNIKPISSQGSDPVDAIKIDGGGFFVQRGGDRVFQLSYDVDVYDYKSEDVTILVPEQCESGITRMAVQRKPDTRLHCVLENGNVAILVFDKAEDVTAWVDFETDGSVEDVFVLPDGIEDDVYYVVKRTINGAEVRYLEKWAMESEAIGGTLNKQADSFVTYTGAPATVIPVAHLEGETVVVWADGAYVGDFVVSGGNITLSVAASNVVAGLTYEARFKSAKLAFAAKGGTSLNMSKRNPSLALIMRNTHRFGIQYAGDFDHLQDLPGVEGGIEVGDNYIWAEYDDGIFPLNGDWSTDTRLCIRSVAPKPATILCLTVVTETNG